MARIEGKDIIKPDLLEGLRNELKLSEDQLKSFDRELLKSLEAQTKLAQGVKTSVKGLRDMNKINKDSKNALSEKEKFQKRLNTLQKKSTQITRAQKETEAAYRVEQQRRNKVITAQAKATNLNIGAFEKLNLKIKNLSDSYRNLLVQEGKETVKTKALKKQILELNAVRNRANQSIGIHSANVGNYRSALTKLTSTLGRLGLAFGVFQLLRSTFTTIRDFDQAQANLSSVLDVNIDKMGALTEQSKRLGETTEFTATAVAGLQLAFAKLGFTEKEIQNVTEATLQLASAAGTDLENAATIVGSTIRAFNLDTSETQRIVDVMAQSFSSSSLDIEKFKTSMAAVAPVAAAMGVSVERTTALIGTLTDAGIDASTAGSGLRNLFLGAKQAGLTLDEALDQIRNSTDKVGASFALFGKRGATLGVVLAENGVTTDRLTDKLENAGGAAEAMATKQLDTLGGSIKLLVSAWEGWILRLNESSGAGKFLQGVIEFLAKNLSFILNTLLKAGVAWIAYTAAVKGAAAASFLLNKRMLVKIRRFKILGAQVFKSSKSMGLYAAALAVVVMAAIEVVTRIQNIKTAQDVLNDVTKETNKRLNEEKIKLQLVGNELFNTKVASEERGAVLRKINAEYGTTLENLENEAEFANQVAAAYNNVVAQMRQKIEIEINQEKIKEKLREISDLKDEIENFGITDILPQVMGTVIGDDALTSIENAEEAVTKLYAQLATLQGSVKSGKSEVNGLGEKNFNKGQIKGAEMTAEKIKENQLKVFKETQNEILRQHEIRLRNEDAAEEFITESVASKRIELARKTGEKIIDLDFEDKTVLSKHELDYLKDVDANQTEHLEKTEVKRIESNKLINTEIKKQDAEAFEEKKKLDEELIKSIRGAIADASNLVASFIENNIKLLDRQIEAQQRAFDDSKSREDDLKRIAEERGLNADEALNVEREAQKKALATQGDLERKKLQAEALIASLQAFAAKVKSGQGNPVQNIKSSILDLKSFVEGNFIKGTEYTLADSLGANGVTDGHLIAADDKEAIFNPNQTAALEIKKGGNSTSDIVNMYRNGFKQNANSISGAQAATVGDKKMHKKMDKLIDATNNIVDPNGLAFNALTKSLQYKNKRKGKTYNFPVSKRN